jgi:hypothetical protein
MRGCLSSKQNACFEGSHKRQIWESERFQRFFQSGGSPQTYEFSFRNNRAARFVRTPRTPAQSKGTLRVGVGPHTPALDKVRQVYLCLSPAFVSTWGSRLYYFWHSAVLPCPRKGPVAFLVSIFLHPLLQEELAYAPAPSLRGGLFWVCAQSVAHSFPRRCCSMPGYLPWRIHTPVYANRRVAFGSGVWVTGMPIIKVRQRMVLPR